MSLPPVIEHYDLFYHPTFNLNKAVFFQNDDSPIKQTDYILRGEKNYLIFSPSTCPPQKKFKAFPKGEKAWQPAIEVLKTTSFGAEKPSWANLVITNLSLLIKILFMRSEEEKINNLNRKFVCNL